MTNHKLVNENSKMQPGLFSWDLQGSDNIGRLLFLVGIISVLLFVELWALSYNSMTNMVRVMIKREF